MREPYDGIYRRLFSHHKLVADLVRHLVGDEVCSELDLETLEPVPAHYVSEELQQREDDAVWRLKHAGDEIGWFYLYVLIEFQKDVDLSMPLRVMTYTGLLYQDLWQRKELDSAGRLPPVLPIVLYNGDREWNAPRDVVDMIPEVPALADFRPRFRYLLVDEARHPLGSMPEDSLLRPFLRLEQARLSDDLLLAIREAIDHIEGLANETLKQDIETWVRRVLVPARFPWLEGESFGGLRTVESRLERTVRGWTEEWFAEGRTEGLEVGRTEGLEVGRTEGLEVGRTEGLEVGRTEGRRDGEAAALLRLLERKFGSVPAAARRRVESAAASCIEGWLDRVLTARTLDDVLATTGQEPPKR